jgi:hypothetical protein
MIQKAERSNGQLTFRTMRFGRAGLLLSISISVESGGFMAQGLPRKWHIRTLPELSITSV